MIRSGCSKDASLVNDADGNARHVIFQIQDISDRKKAEELIHHAAFHDALTGLPNRTLFSDRLGRAVERAKRSSDHEYGVIFVDLDRFKIVNDSLGHSQGDKLLVGVTNRLESCVRSADTVARLGGDEFAILLDGAGSIEYATLCRRTDPELPESAFRTGWAPFCLNRVDGNCIFENGLRKPRGCAP